MSRPGVVAGLLAAGLALAPLAGAAQPDKQGSFFSPLPASGGAFVNTPKLHFTLVPSGRRNVLFAWGQIDSGDSGRFDAAIQLAKPIDEIVLFSPGGDLEEGLQIGRIIRREKLSTRVPRGAMCASACNFMFMGGVVRSVDLGAEFVVHMFDKKESPEAILLKLIEAKASADKGLRVAQESPEPQRPRAGLLPLGLPDLSAIGGVASQAAHPTSPAPGTSGEAGCPARSLAAMQGDLMAELQNNDTASAVAHDVQRIAKTFLDPAVCEEFRTMLKPLAGWFVDNEQDDARTAAEIARFLVDMSLSLRFLTEFANIPNHEPRALTRDELRDFNVVNTE
jgi:hypothetical protein